MTTETTEQIIITEPGIYTDLPAIDYHRQHDWLSASNMKRLVAPSTPAHFKAALKAGEERKRHFDLGKIVHTLVLGDGEKFEVVQALNRAKEEYDATSYDTVSAREHRDAIYERGNIPILRHELTAAQAMADAVREHQVASQLFSGGRPEVSAFWVDPASGVKCRARFDWLPDAVEGRRMIIPDLKTAATADPREFSKAAARFGYYIQHVHYLDAVRALGLDDDPAFVFVAVEKEDPHLVMVGQFAEAEDRKLARAVVSRARQIFKECTETGDWWGYPPGVNALALPTYTHYDMTEYLNP